MTRRDALAVLIAAFIASVGAVRAQTPAPAPALPDQPVYRSPKPLDHVSWIDRDSFVATMHSLTLTQEIVRVNVRSPELKVLATGSCPTLSPDKRQVAWVPTGSSRDIAVLDLTTSERQQLTRNLIANCVAWSPDGRRLAVRATRPPASRGDLLIVSARTGQTEQVVAAGDLILSDFAWSPDSGRVAFSASQIAVLPGPRIIFLIKRIDQIEASSGRRSTLLDVPGEVPAADVLFTPDGRNLVLTLRREVYLWDGTSPRKLFSGRSPAWHPDGMLSVLRGYECNPAGVLCTGDDVYLLRWPP